MDLVKEMTKIRKEKKLSLEKLSNLSGISTTTIYNWENGHYAPTLESISNVIEAMGCELTIITKDEVDENYIQGYRDAIDEVMKKTEEVRELSHWMY